MLRFALIQLYAFHQSKKHWVYQLLNSPVLLITCTLFCLLTKTAKAQENTEDNIGGTVSISLTFGSTINRIGIGANTFYFEDFMQVNASIRLFFNFRSFGPRHSSRELQASLGGVGSWGHNSGEYYLLLSPISNQTGREYSAGYAYTLYADNNQSSQGTGIIGLQIDKFQLAHENDILVGSGNDRFRTGAFLLAYQEEDLRFAINYTSWTGDPKSEGAQHISNSTYPAKRGYKDLSKATHGQYSHGIISLQAEGVLDYGQVIRTNIGVDGEQVRNFMQNRFMHEQITKGVHYPMLDTNGQPYLFQDNQKIKPLRFFYQGSLNPPLFY